MKKYSEMVCKPTCAFFPDMSCGEGQWEYDKDIPYIKRRTQPKKFKCCYDGHCIDWYTCPLLNKTKGE